MVYFFLLFISDLLIIAEKISKPVFQFALLKKFFSNLLYLLKSKIVSKRKTRVNPEYFQAKVPQLIRNINKKVPAAAVLVIILIIFWFTILKNLPSPKNLTDRNLAVSTKIYDRNGNLLYKIYKDKNRSVISLSNIPDHIKLATLAAEDAEFYSHPGFSIRGIFRAIIKNITEGKITGGSTITQQLVKNALLTPERTISRKIKELILSVQIETIYTKDQILEMYLNEVSYGGTAYGISEAAKTYFNKSVSQLSLAEAALLAGLTKRPTGYSPFGLNPNLALERQREVLNLMRINKYISADEETQAKNERLTFSRKGNDIKAPHFVMFIRDYLENKYGKERVETGGLEVYTTLDLALQTEVEKIVREEIDKLPNYKVGNGAALVIKPATGEILAMVGSRNYFDSQDQGNFNVIFSLRQPGSSIKVINYAYALANGYTAASILSDTPIVFPQKGSGNYIPKNYDGLFRGNITLRMALAESRNIPAVRVLHSYGIDKMLEQAKKMGITSWDNPNQYGLSLTLGGGEVKLFDLATVYAVLANYGKRPELSGIIRVSDYRGKILEEQQCLKDSCHQPEAVNPKVAFLLTDILKDNQARAPAFGRSSQLVIKNHPEVAVKTGTSNNLRDNLTIGYNQDYLTAVWVGNNDNSPMSRVASGVTGASPIWNRIMNKLLSDKPSREWEVPEGMVKVTICTFAQTLACTGCADRVEWFINGTQPKKPCRPETIKPDIQQKPIPQILDDGASI